MRLHRASSLRLDGSGTPPYPSGTPTCRSGRRSCYNLLFGHWTVRQFDYPIISITFCISEGSQKCKASLIVAPSIWLSCMYGKSLPLDRTGLTLMHDGLNLICKAVTALPKPEEIDSFREFRPFSHRGLMLLNGDVTNLVVLTLVCRVK